MFVFNSFRLDVANASLSQDKQAILLTPKAFNVLRYLLEHAGQLVSKDDLWRAVWPGISVTDATLTNCVSEIRKALGDDSKVPRYIETLHRLGYRFIASVSTEPARIGGSIVSRQDSPPPVGIRPHASYFVGRQAESAQLHKLFEHALQGERQIVFVTGEPGIGKTTLVEEFLRQEQVTAGEQLWIGRGQCIEHYGVGEPYLPVLDALGRLCREPGGRQLLELLDKHAPAWLVQMPGLLEAAESKELQGRVAGVTRDRMLRELADAIEMISQERPLVLRLEDLHWSDHSTLDWLAFLARRQESARLLVLGTYRPVEVIVREHPLKNLKHELQIHGLCKELPLPLLNEAEVMEYLNLRFASLNSSSEERRTECHPKEPMRKLAQTIYERTDGNPLFMVNVFDYLVEGKGLKSLHEQAGSPPAEALATNSIEMPPSLAQMIEHNLERLNPDEQVVLEAASITGIEFPAAAVAAALEQPVSDIETCCTRLARHQQFIHARGVEELPDGTVTTTFRFLHVLYRDVLRQRVPAGRQVELHRRIAERGEEAYDDKVDDVAVELAYHYRLAGNRAKALKYLELAAERATARRAYHEAERHYREAVEALRVLPESPEHLRHELSLLLALGSTMGPTRGITSAETMEVYARARSLAEQAGSSDSIRLIWALASSAIAKGELQTGLALSRELLEIACRSDSSSGQFLAHTLYGSAYHFRGVLIDALNHFLEASKHYHDDELRGFPFTPPITRVWMKAVTEWHLGYPARAFHCVDEMLALARQLDDPVSLCMAYFSAGRIYQLTGDWPRMLQASEQSLGISAGSRYPELSAAAKINVAYGCARIGKTNGAAEAIRAGLSELKWYATRRMMLGWLAEAHLLAGDIAEATASLEEALEFNVEERLFQPELLRLRGELCRRGGLSRAAMFEMAEQDFRAAIDAACSMSAKSDELRAITSLARLLVQESRRDEARAMLGEIYGWFTEGFDTADLREAKLLLDELSR